MVAAGICAGASRCVSAARVGYYPLWPPVLGFAALLLLANTRLFASADAPPSLRPARLQTIDGLRGFLALSVVFFHGAVYHRYLRDGVWEGPSSAFYRLLGTGGVAVFFMITSYLFWCRLIDEHGRPDWVQLYVGRVFRIAPLYLTMILLMVVLVMIQARWHFNVPVRAFLRGLAPWLALGLLDPTDINAHPATLILNAGVAWSLRYEWLFYLSLPLLAWVAGRGPARTGVVLAAVAAGFVWTARGRPYVLAAGDPAFTTLFLIGMACATADRSGWTAKLSDRTASVIFAALALVLFSTCQIAYAPLAMALLGSCFYLVVSGCSLFGLLTHRASKRLGDISYGIYLLQGLVLASLFQFQRVRAFALASPQRHWAIILTGAVLLVGLAALAHAWIERPGILLGKQVLRFAGGGQQGLGRARS